MQRLIEVPHFPACGQAQCGVLLECAARFGGTSQDCWQTQTQTQIQTDTPAATGTRGRPKPRREAEDEDIAVVGRRPFVWLQALGRGGR